MGNRREPDRPRPRWFRWLGRALGVLCLGIAVVVASQIKGDIAPRELEQRYAGGASRFVEMGDLRVHYRDEGDGPTLVLLHGTGSSLQTWDGWTEALRSKFRVVRMDLPGFALTGPSPNDDYRIETYVEFLEAFRKRLGLDAFALAGNSLGGIIA